MMKPLHDLAGGAVILAIFGLYMWAGDWTFVPWREGKNVSWIRPVLFGISVLLTLWMIFEFGFYWWNPTEPPR